ncbi:hypothetical protein Barb6_01191 [Bacteroidales bacterium Barb6]|nr:hypothetical protein Barb6_01191 [Bacteroidales bacterium Barb6]
MPVVGFVIQVGGYGAVMAVIFGKRVIDFAFAVDFPVISVPVVLPCNRIHVLAVSQIHISRYAQIQAFGKQVPLRILDARHDGFALPEPFPENDFHNVGVLNVRPVLSQSDAEQKPVGKPFPDNACFCYDRFVVIRIMETANPLVVRTEHKRFQIKHRRMYPIVIVRIVLKNVQLYGKPVLSRISGVDI